MRDRLSEHLKRLEWESFEWKIPFLLFDIHSFGGGGRAFGLPSGVEPYIVLLGLPYDMDLSQVLSRRLSAQGVPVVLLEASTENDIIREAAFKEGKTVIVEFKEESSVSDTLFDKTMDAIQETVRLFEAKHKQKQK